MAGRHSGWRAGAEYAVSAALPGERGLFHHPSARVSVSAGKSKNARRFVGVSDVLRRALRTRFFPAFLAFSRRRAVSELGYGWGNVGLPPKPAWGLRPQTPSCLSLRDKQEKAILLERIQL